MFYHVFLPRLSTVTPVTLALWICIKPKYNTNGTNCSQIETEEWINTVVPVYILIISALGFVLNVFVLIHKKPCTVAEIYLSNLAAADLLLLAVNVSNRFDWPFGQFLCKVFNPGINMNTYCSIYFFVLVSIDCYVAVVHTMSHNRAA